jgi:hypothetical protein
VINLFIVSVIIVLIITFKMPRNRTRHEVFVAIMFGFLMNVLTDMYLDLKYHLYWYFDKEQIEWEYLIVGIGEIAILVIIFNYFPLYSSTIKKLLYICCWTVILILLELYAVYLDVLHYGVWNPLYSAIVYFISLYILYIILNYTDDRREKKSI